MRLGHRMRHPGDVEVARMRRFNLLPIGERDLEGNRGRTHIDNWRTPQMKCAVAPESEMA